MKTIAKIIKVVTNFLTNTGLTWVGYGAGAIAVFLFTPKSWFWGLVLGILVGLFLMKNLEIVKQWAEKQLNDIKKKF